MAAPVGLVVSLSLIPYPPGDNYPKKAQTITITHFTRFLLCAPPPKRLGDNGTYGRKVGRVEGDKG